MQYVFSLLKSTFRLHNLGMLFFMLLNCLVLFLPLASTVGTDAGTPALALAVFILCSAVYYALVLAVGAVFIRLMFGGNQVVIGSDTSPLVSPLRKLMPPPRNRTQPFRTTSNFMDAVSNILMLLPSAAAPF